MGRVSPVEGLHNLRQIGDQHEEEVDWSFQGQCQRPGHGSKAIRDAMGLQPGDVFGLGSSTNSRSA